MSDEIKKITIKEFREKGFLQEANRLFFHPLGLALAIMIDDNGKYSLESVWDYREDPEGVFYCNNVISKEKINYVTELRASKIKERLSVGRTLGFTIDDGGIQHE